MKCRVTKRCFYEGSIRKPGDMVEFSGAAKEMPSYLEKVSTSQGEKEEKPKG